MTPHHEKHDARPDASVSALIERARAGDAEAFAALTRRYAHMAWSHAFSLLGDFHLAEDAAQEAFIAAYFGLRDLQNPVAFAAWLRGIVGHQCARIARRRRFERSFDFDTLFPAAMEMAVTEIAGADCNPQRRVEQEELRVAVRASIAALPQSQREVTALFYLRDYSQKEIALLLGVPLSQVNNRLYAARQKLKRRMLSMMNETEVGTAQDGALAQSLTRDVGKISGVRGAILEAKFEGDGPRVFDWLRIEAGPHNTRVDATVVQRLRRGMVRALVVGAGLASGLARSDAAPAVAQPAQPAPPIVAAPAVTTPTVAAGTRAVNVGAAGHQSLSDEDIARAIESLGDAPATKSSAVSPVARTQILETGIKPLDLLCPLPRGGKLGLAGPGGVGATVLLEELMFRFKKSRSKKGVAVFYFLRPADAAIAEGIVQEPEYAGDNAGAVQTFWMLTDNATDPSWAASLKGLDAAIYLSPVLAAQGIYPAIDPLVSTSRLLSPQVVGQEHYEVAQRVREILRRARQLMADPVFLELVACRANRAAAQRARDFVAERLPQLSVEDRILVSRARKVQNFLAHPFYVATLYTSIPAHWVSREETIAGCREILDGLHDDLPEAAFLMTGSIEDVLDKAKKLKAQKLKEDKEDAAAKP